MCLLKHCDCRQWRVASPICNNSRESDAIHHRYFRRHEKVLTAAKWNQEIKDSSAAWESFPGKTNGSPQGYWLLNIKHDLREMKVNRCECGQKLIKTTLLNGQRYRRKSKEIRRIKTWILQKRELSLFQWKILASLHLQILFHP